MRQVWKPKDHSERTSSLDINLTIFHISGTRWLDPHHQPSCLMLFITRLPSLIVSTSPMKHILTVILRHTHLTGDSLHVVLTRTNTSNSGTHKLCHKPIAMPQVTVIALSPVLNDQSFGRLIAILCLDTYTITLFDVYTGHLYPQC